MKMTMRKMLAVLATLAMLCAVLPLGSLFSAVADDANLIANGDFATDISGWSASGGTVLTHEDGALHADFNESWGFVNAGTYNLKANTDYQLTFKAKSINGAGVTPKMNKTDWSGTVVEKGMSFTEDWADYEWTFTTTDITSLMLFFQSGCDASAGQEMWLDDVVLKEAAGEEPEQPEQPADDNLIVNGDFETGDNTGWEIWQSTSISADAAKDGAYGAHLVGNGTWGGMLNQTVAVEAGKQYKLSFWINVNAMGVNLQVKDGSGAMIDGVGGWFDANKKDKVIEYTFTAPDNSVLINFCGSGNSPEDVYVDNLSLVCISNGDAPAEPSNDGYIINGDLETGDIAPWDNLWGSCPTAEVIEGGKDSAYALNIVSKTWNHVRQTGIAVEANTDYKITVWAKNAANMCLLVKDGGDTTDIANVGVNAGDEWTQFTVEFNSGEFTSIIFSLMGGEGDSQYGIFDNIVMEKVGGEEPEPEPELPVDGALVEDFEDALSDDWTLATKGTSGIVDGAMKLEGNAYEEILTSPVIALKKGVTYTISFDIKLINKGEIAFIIKNCYEDNAGKGSDISTEYIRDAKTNAWTTYTFSFKNEDLARDFASLLFVNNAGTDFYVDNIVVTSDEKPEEPDVPSSDVLNATFDSGEFDGILSSSDISVADGELQFNVTKDWGNVYTGFEVEANTDYEVSFRAKSKLGKTVWAKFHKADWSGDICQETVALSTSWKDYTYTMNSGDNTYVYLLIQYAGYAAEGETVWFDYITVKKAGGSEPDEPTSGIVNGGFENGSEGWELGSSASITDEDAHGGSYSLKLENPGMWAAAAVQNVPVKPNTEYVIEMWVNRIENRGALNLFLMDAADNRNLEVVEGQIWFNTNTNGWEKKTIVVNTGAASEIVLKWSAEGANAGVMLIDDMTIAEKNAPQPSAGLVQDSGFESGALNSNIVPVGVAGAWYNVWGSCTTTFDTPGYDGSNYALTIETEGKWTQVRQDKIPVKPNTDYVVWARVKNTTGMSIVMKDGNDTVGITTDEQGAIPEDMTNTWMLHKLEFNSGEYDSVCLLLIAIAENGGMGTFDDVQIYEKGKEPTAGETYPIKNAGFESGELDPGTTPGSVTGAWYNVWGACTYSFETPGHDKSQYAISIEAPGDWQQIRQDGIPVEPNTDYTVVAYVKNPINFNLVVKTANDAANIADYGIENDLSNTWIRLEIPFNSGSETAVCLLLIGNDQGPSSALFDNVQIYKKGEEPAEPEPDAPATEGPMQLDEYGVAINRPVDAESNLILNGSFEDAEGGQWQSVISDTLYVVDDETAPEGNKTLFFNTSGVTENNKVIFYLDVEPNTDYVFSAWVKGAFISADNRFNATFGVTDWKDNFCVYQDAKFSNKNRQIVPTAWDNEWHLRAVQFNSGANIKVGIGFAGAESQMWIDGIALYTVDNGIKYGDARQNCYIMGSTMEKSQAGCADEDNLIVDGHMNGAEAEEFWASAEGYKNGFLTFAENEYEYGTSLKYTGDDKSCDTYAIKWLEVKPNTSYTFSVDMRIIESGDGKLVLLDGKKRDCFEFLMVDFDKDSWGAGWVTVAMEFDTKEFDRIGIAVSDGGGEVLLDNMRFFETANLVEGGVEDDYIEPPYSFDDPDEPTDPDSPDTGVSALGAVLALALVPSSAAVAFKLRRKKEDEE